MIRLQAEPIRLEDVVASVRADGDGAVALFLGTVRDRNAGRRVRFLEYHAYDSMAEAEIERIAALARERFPGVSRVAAVHRTGRVEIGETAVAVAVASPHRAEAMDACRMIIDALKRTVPIWKKEHFEGGAVWIEGAGSTPAGVTPDDPDSG